MKTLLALTLAACGSVVSADTAPSQLPRSSPEAQGVSSSAILAFVEGVEQKIEAVHSFMLLRHGQVVAEGWWAPFGKDDPHMLYSLSKSFTSTAVGMAVTEGKLSIDDPVLKFFPEDAPAEPSDNLKAMRVRDLLAMSTGHHNDDLLKFSFTGAEVLTKAFLALPVAHKPGTHFLYNTPATYMLSAIVQKVTGATVLDYLGPRLFGPLGIKNPTWESSPQGISMGGFGLKVTTEDIARFGQLYLQKGTWRGKRLLPAEWVAAATARQTSNGSNPASDWDQGYGYQFWRCRHGLYRGDGAFGQFCLVMPEQDTVLAITSGTRDLQGVLNVVYDQLLDHLQGTPLARDEPAHAKLVRKLAGLALPVQTGDATGPVAPSVTGKNYALPANGDKIEAVRLEQGVDGATVAVRIAGRDIRVPCGRGEWRKGGSWPFNGGDQKVAASGAWTANDTYTARLHLYETPYRITLGLRFSDDRLLFNLEYNVALNGALKHPEVVGVLAPAPSP